MLSAAVCLIKELHDIGNQCGLDGSTYNMYVSCLLKAPFQYDAVSIPATEIEIIQSTSKLLAPVY